MRFWGEKKSASSVVKKGHSQEEDILPFLVVQPCLLKQLVSTVWSDILPWSEDVCLAVSSFQEEGSKKTKEQSQYIAPYSRGKNAFTSGRIKPSMCLPLPEINCHGYLYQVSEFVFCSVMCCLQTERSLDLDVVFFSELLRNLRKALVQQ